MFYPYTMSLAHQYVRLTTAGWQAVPAGGIIVPSYIPSSFSSHSGGERTTNERTNKKRNKSTKAANWYIFFLRRNLGNHSAKAKQKGENARKQAKRQTQYRKRKQQQQQPARLGF